MGISQLSSLLASSTKTSSFNFETGPAASNSELETSLADSGIPPPLPVIQSFVNVTEIAESRPQPKIMCFVTIETKSPVIPGVVKATWGEDCDRGIFFVGPREDITNDTQFLNLPSKGSNSWATTRSLWQKMDPKDSEAVVVAADSSFVVVRNIRAYLRGRAPKPRYLGRESDKGPFCMFNAYILTRPAVDNLRKELVSGVSGSCDASGPEDPGDVRLGKCLKSIDIVAETMRDKDGKIQMYLKDPIDFFHAKPAAEHTTPECCTKLPVALFNVGKVSNVRTGAFSELYKFDYLIRRTAVAGLEHLRPYNTEDMPSAKQIGF